MSDTTSGLTRKPATRRNAADGTCSTDGPALRSFRRIDCLSHGDTNTGNALVQGENLDVLCRLREQYAGRVRCIYTDPPYNNQEHYRHYRDSSSHTSWLEMIVDRLAAMKPLLSADGSIWISIDDREMHYLKVAADDIFGRKNFVTTVVW